MPNVVAGQATRANIPLAVLKRSGLRIGDSPAKRLCHERLRQVSRLRSRRWRHYYQVSCAHRESKAKWILCIDDERKRAEARVTQLPERNQADDWRKLEALYRRLHSGQGAVKRLRKYAGAAAEDVVEFCRDHEILRDLEAAIKAVEQAFPTNDKIEVYIEENPEEAHKYIVVKVRIHADVKSFMAAYRQCISMWSSSLSVKAIDYISLGHSVVRP
jgi:hypothetical protein